jgi:hypothetical protein
MIVMSFDPYLDWLQLSISFEVLSFKKEIESSPKYSQMFRKLSSKFTHHDLRTKFFQPRFH